MFNEDYITVVWNGKTEKISNIFDHDRVDLFLRFLYENEEKCDDFKIIAEWLREVFKRERIMYLIQDDKYAKNATWNDAKKEFDKWMENEKIFDISIDSFHFQNGYENFDERDDDYGPEPEIVDFVIDQLAKELGWRIFKYDEQKMDILMERLNGWNFDRGWVCNFRHPDFLYSHIDLDSIYENAKKKMEKYDLMLEAEHTYYSA